MKSMLIKVVTARTESEIADVYKIRHDAYTRVGYIGINKNRQFSDHYDGAVMAVSHLAYLGNDPIGTLRTIIDSDQYGLPMDREGFTKYLTPLRQRGRRLVEICRLALLDKQHGEHKRILLALEKAMLYHALANGATDFVIAVSPENAPYYEHVLLFKRFSDVQPYASLNRMAVLLQLDITNARQLYQHHVVDGFHMGAYFFGLNLVRPKAPVQTPAPASARPWLSPPGLSLPPQSGLPVGC